MHCWIPCCTVLPGGEKCKMSARPMMSELSIGANAQGVIAGPYLQRRRDSSGSPSPRNASPMCTFGAVPFSPDMRHHPKKDHSYVKNQPQVSMALAKALESHAQDGFTLHELVAEQPGLTYDDFLMLPGHIYFAPADVSTTTRITKNIRLKCPFVSSPMDTVSESAVAISMALMGGIGILHYNCSIEEQAQMVRNVKRFKNGFITDPLVMGLDATVADMRRVKQERGFSGVPITDTGKIGGKLLGMVCTRDIDFVADDTLSVEQVMTRDLIVAQEGCSLSEANELMKSSKVCVSRQIPFR